MTKVVAVSFADSTVSYSTDAGMTWEQTSNAPNETCRGLVRVQSGQVYGGFNDGTLWRFTPE